MQILGPDSRDEKISIDKVICFLSLFQDRRTDIVAYRGDIFNQRRFRMVNWIKGKFLTQEMRKL